MKKFQVPAIEVKCFDVEDIMTASSGSTGGNDILPDDEFGD